jgi:hypothetical protein
MKRSGALEPPGPFPVYCNSQLLTFATFTPCHPSTLTPCPLSQFWERGLSKWNLDVRSS